MPLSADRPTVIAGGTVVAPDGRARADVLIADGSVVAVGEVDREGAQVIDAAGCLVLPGAIDVHTHPFGNLHDDSRSALVGGTTSALAFVDAAPGERPAEAARRTLTDEMSRSLIDLAFHSVIWEPQAYRRGDLAAVAELGVGSIKLWLAYIELGIMADDDVAFAVMQEAAELGMVTLAHCENGRVIDVLTRQLVEAGRLGLDSLPRSRPIQLEAECIHRFLVMAEMTGGSAYVVHMTGRAPLEELVAARRRGVDVHGEVCIHHLLFDVADHGGADGLRYVMTPPLRTADDREALLAGLRSGTLDTLASDHCHLRLDRDKLPLAGDFTKVPTGLPGIGARLPIGFALGGDQPLAPERLVEAACTAPARIFGLYPRKGLIAPGSDADLVVWDPGQRGRLTLERIDDGLDWTPYDGIDIPGAVRHVLARGRHAVVDGHYDPESGHRGEYLASGRVSPPSSPRPR
jgi:dihydropyrimidinase